MRILVVGGAGYVGGAVTDYLLTMTAFHQVRVYDNLTFDEQYSKPLEFVNGDVRDEGKLRPHLAWADVVIWLAALVGDGACQVRESEAVAINRDAVRFLAQNFNGRILFTSTCSVYGAQDGILSEESPTSPISIYARTKLESEHILTSMNKNAVIIRFGTLFGLSDSFCRVRFDLVVNTMTLSAMKNGKIVVNGGSQWRPLLHVRDAGRLSVRMALECPPGIFNLHAINIQIGEIAEAVRETVGTDVVDIDHVDVSDVDARNYRVLSQPAHMLGYNPNMTIDTGIREIRDLLNSGRIRNPYSDRYVNHRYLQNERDKE